MSDGRLGDDFPFAVDPVGQLVDHQFGNVGEHRQTAGHVAVQRAVADRQFGFVSGAEDHGSKFVGQRHQIISADARLNIFFGDIGSERSENGRQDVSVGFEDFADGHGDQVDAEILCHEWPRRSCCPPKNMGRAWRRRERFQGPRRPRRSRRPRRNQCRRSGRRGLS